jgi:hypothetical protein
MLDTLAKAVDLLKSSGWQTAMIAAACGLLLYLNSVEVIPAMEPWMVILTWAAMLVSVGLALAALASVLQHVMGGVWEQWLRKRSMYKIEQAFRDYIPHLTDKERQILGYLRHKKMKTFTADNDGGYAGTLLARRFIRYIGVGDRPSTWTNARWPYLSMCGK